MSFHKSIKALLLQLLYRWSNLYNRLMLLFYLVVGFVNFGLSQVDTAVVLVTNRNEVFFYATESPIETFVQVYLGAKPFNSKIDSIRLTKGRLVIRAEKNSDYQFLSNVLDEIRGLGVNPKVIEDMRFYEKKWTENEQIIPTFTTPKLRENGCTFILCEYDKVFFYKPDEYPNVEIITPEKIRKKISECQNKAVYIKFRPKASKAIINTFFLEINQFDNLNYNLVEITTDENLLINQLVKP